jgi:hypothetical protein|tara:strand:- start:537 stop:884 length:348 start_codon:yes stop_codon:yes gene_type:complete
MKLSDTYNDMDNDNILEANLLLEKIQLQQKYLTNLVHDLGKEINMLVSVSRALLSIMKTSNLTNDTEFESLVNTHHKSINKLLDKEDERYKRIVDELKEVSEQIEMIHTGEYGES